MLLMMDANQRKNIIRFGIAAAIVLVAIALLQWPGAQEEPEEAIVPSRVRAVLRAGADAILVNDQPVTTSVVVTLADLNNDGFVVIHELNGDKPGAVLGASDLLLRGGNPNTTVRLKSPVDAGTELFAMLYKDNGDKGFHLARDRGVYVDGEPLGMSFTLR